jgi:hypothetical protein
MALKPLREVLFQSDPLRVGIALGVEIEHGPNSAAPYTRRSVANWIYAISRWLHLHCDSRGLRQDWCALPPVALHITFLCRCKPS